MKRLELVDAASATQLAHPCEATLVGFDDEGWPLVELEGGGRVAARSTVPLSAWDLHSTVLVVFVEGDPRRPVVSGRVLPPNREPQVRIDDRQIMLEARERVEIRCGEASVVLTADGRLSFKGVSIDNRAKKAVRIKGGSIKLN